VGSRNRIDVQASLAIKLVPVCKICKAKRAGIMGSSGAVKHKVLSSNPSTTKKLKNKLNLGGEGRRTVPSRPA
jgi:hypothetical protein